MYYLIRNLTPRTDTTLGAHYFSIDLHPRMRDLVARSGLKQNDVNAYVENRARSWLDACGYDDLWDPDDPGFHGWDIPARRTQVVRDAEGNRTDKWMYGKNARPLYDAHSIRVRWSEWGCHNIQVPGNACGLDICDHEHALCCVFHRGATLSPHNIDCWAQKQLFLLIFTDLMETVALRGDAYDTQIVETVARS